MSKVLSFYAECSRALWQAKLGKNPTVYASRFSDWIAGPILNRMVSRYAHFIHTPVHFVQMLFLVEDKRFPVHLGVDPIAIARAVVFNALGGSVQGASTITQQLFTIKTSTSKRLSRSLRYKLAQTFWALGQSIVTSKISLFQRYIETVYWGRSYYGLDRAIEVYFGGTRISLTAAQSFFLAERIAAPNRFSIRRVSNLLDRAPIRVALLKNGGAVEHVRTVYEEVHKNGGGGWQVLER